VISITVNSSTPPTPSSPDELKITYTTVSEDINSFTGKLVLENPNTSYVWNGTCFAVRSVDFRTTSEIASVEYFDGGNPGYTVNGDIVTLDLGWRSLFPYNTSVEIQIEAKKAGTKVFPQDFKTHYVRGEDIIYPPDPGLPASWTKQKADLSINDLVFNETEYYKTSALPIQDKLIMYDSFSSTQVQIGLATNIDYPINGASNVRAWIPTKFMAMGMACAREELNFNPNYLAALSTKENWGAGLNPDPSSGGIKVMIDGEEWNWPIVIDHPDGPYQVENGNFGDLVKFFPDYFPPNASHDDYTKVSADMSNPNWISSAIVAAISITATRELLNAVPEAKYNDFMANAVDPWAEMAILTFAFNRGMGSLCAKKLFSDNRQEAMNSTDIVEDFGMGGFASHVPSVRAMIDAMNRETVHIYDAEITWADMESCIAELRTFFANGVPTETEWSAMKEDVHKAFNVLAQHWGGSHVSFRYDFLTLLRVAKQYRPKPYHPRPTGQHWYYQEQSTVPKPIADPGWNNFSEASEFKLNQNYPNPFNPTTSISYDIPEATNVSIVIYDINGRLVEKLVSEYVQSGRYTAVWNAANHPSGIYIMRMTAGSFHCVMKMMLMK